MHHQEMMANDINGLQQMDDAEYGDEEGMPATGGMQVSNALAEQRATKKRAQDDVKLLANRIALLKLEEKKVSDTYEYQHSLSAEWLLFILIFSWL